MAVNAQIQIIFDFNDYGLYAPLPAAQKTAVKTAIRGEITDKTGSKLHVGPINRRALPVNPDFVADELDIETQLRDGVDTLDNPGNDFERGAKEGAEYIIVDGQQVCIHSWRAELNGADWNLDNAGGVAGLNAHFHFAVSWGEPIND